MDEVNLPIYRAKKIGSEEYVEGFLSWYFKLGSGEKYYAIKADNNTYYEIDPITLSINFSDMKDSEGTPIFASLNKKGKGGDVVANGYGESVIALYEEGSIRFRYEEALPLTQEIIEKCEDDEFLGFYELWQIRDKLKSEVVGIQE